MIPLASPQVSLRYANTPNEPFARSSRWEEMIFVYDVAVAWFF